MNYWLKRGVISYAPKGSAGRQQFDAPTLRKIFRLLEEFALQRSSEATRTQAPDAHADLSADAPSELMNRFVETLSDCLYSDPGESRDRFSSPLRKVAIETKRIVAAQHCSIFLLKRGTSHEIRLIADSHEDPAHSRVGLTISFGKASSGLSSSVMATRRPLNLFGPELAAHPTFSGSKPVHLPNERYSFLGVPILDSRKRAVGVVKVDNKLPPAKDLRVAPFNDADEERLALISAFLSIAIEASSLLETLYTLDEMLAESPSYEEFAGRVLESALHLTSSDRGEVWHVDRSSPKKGLLSAATIRGDNSIKHGDFIDFPSITYTALKSGEAQLVKDVEAECRPDYRQLNVSTSSEIACPVFVHDMPIGVINIEADDRESEGGLGGDDLRLASRLSARISVAAQLMALRAAVVSYFSQRDEKSSDEQLDRFNAFLTEIAQRTRFRRGIAYAADFSAGVLATAGFQGLPRSLRTQRRLHLDQHYLATEVFRTQRTIFSSHPEVDGTVSAEGLRIYEIRGSLLGVPVVFEAELMPIVVGVLALWTEDGEYFSEGDVADDIRFATAAAKFRWQ
ncbi:MAG: GAF domain-containing protein [Bryobacteraceae bacterium]